MKVLITGASGFIGGHLAHTLVDQGHEVQCLARPGSRLRQFKNAGIRIIRGSFEDDAVLAEAVRGVDWVFHLAAVINAARWSEYRLVNTVYTELLLAACSKSPNKIRRFVFVSSVSAAGDSGSSGYPDENADCRPDDWYGKSKLEAEAAVLSYAAIFPVTILRPPFVIGPRQKELQLIMQLLKAGIYLTMGSGRKQSILIYVDDLISAMLLCAENPEAAGKVYFVSDARSDGYAWREIVATISEVLGRRNFWLSVPFSVQLLFAGLVEGCTGLFGKTSPLTKDYVLKIRNAHWLYDASAIHRDLGYTAQYSLRRGIEEVVAYDSQIKRPVS
ncbi:MAG: NAD-dependent epimerase/dehydratase family protein [Spirochaetes bacterium]|nr:NAD-dependent epimerase/dehydratase family protein [Spirochaetota bacterium]